MYQDKAPLHSRERILMHHDKGIYLVLHIKGSTVSIVAFHESLTEALRSDPRDSGFFIYDAVRRMVLYRGTYQVTAEGGLEQRFEHWLEHWTPVVGNNEHDMEQVYKCHG